MNCRVCIKPCLATLNGVCDDCRNAEPKHIFEYSTGELQEELARRQREVDGPAMALAEVLHRLKWCEPWRGLGPNIRDELREGAKAAREWKP